MLFNKAYQSLNKEQRQAVDWIEGPVMVIAGPGTGKTQILTMRLANILLKTHVNPENILALTFSESAAFEMRERLSQIIGTAAYRAEISTFHSFSNSIIHSYPDEFPYLLSSDAITEIEQLNLLEKILEKLSLKLLKPFGDPHYYLKDILSAINDLKKEAITPETLEKALRKQEKEFKERKDLYHEKGKYRGEMKGQYQELKKDIEKTKEFFKIFEAYQKALLVEKKYDFNDMLLETITALQKNKSLLLRIQEKYQYILIDEHQDTNAAQNKLIELIAGFYKIPNLFVVGDANQAIYRFQGASLENFLYFKKLYKGAKLINLEKNYRSQQLILDSVKSLIDKNVSANILPKKSLKSTAKYEKEKINIGGFSTHQMEYEYVAHDLEYKIKHGLDYSKLAVLARRNADLLPLAQILKRKGIKFVTQSDSDILTDLEIQKLLLIFQAIDKPFDEASLIKALHLDFSGIDPFEIYRLLNSARREKIALSEYLEKKKISKKIKGFYLKYKGWLSLNDNIAFDDLFIKIVNESGFREFVLKSPDRYQLLNKLTGLFDEIKLQLSKNPQFSLKDFLSLIETAQKHKVSLHSKNELSWAEGVKLMTVHKSKGLEFDYVYVINVFEGRWGSVRKRGAKIKIPWQYLGAAVKANISFEEVEDERRLFYVALTRARKGIILTYARAGIEGRKQFASQFLNEIDKKFMRLLDTEKFEKTFNVSQILDAPKKIHVDSKDRIYLNWLFRQRQLTVTALENFLECPWKYFFRNLVILPDVKNKHLIYGTAVHYALDCYLRLRHFRDPGRQFLIEKFAENIAKEGLSGGDLTQMTEKGGKALEFLYDNVIPLWPKNIQSETKIRGVPIGRGIILGGRIDMIEPLAKGGLARVHDFKTGKAKTRRQIDGSKQDSKYNYFRQLVFYKILLDRYRPGLFKMREGIIDFVEPDEKGRFRSEIFEVKDKDVKDLEELIRTTADQIINLRFWDARCKDQKCEYCKLRAMIW